MDLRNQYIEPDNSYHQPSHDPSGGTMVLVVTLTIISVVLTSVLAVVYYSKKNNPETDVTSGTMINSYIAVSTATPTPVPPLADYQNPILYPATAGINIDPDAIIDDSVNPSMRGITQNIIVGSDYLGLFEGESHQYRRSSVLYADSRSPHIQGQQLQKYGFVRLPDSVRRHCRYTDSGLGVRERTQPAVFRHDVRMDGIQAYGSASYRKMAFRDPFTHECISFGYKT